MLYSSRMLNDVHCLYNRIFVMKKLCFALLLVCALTLSIEINNIHNGYRNVYKGTPVLLQETLSLTSYVHYQ